MHTKMLVLLPGEPSFNNDDGAQLRAFLLTPTGQHFMRRLLFSRPAVEGYDPEKRRIRSDERAGFEACIQEILVLAEYVNPEPAAA